MPQLKIQRITPITAIPAPAQISEPFYSQAWFRLLIVAACLVVAGYVQAGEIRF